MTTRVLLALASLVAMASCSAKLELVKRKYNRGYYVSVSKKPKSNGNLSLKTEAVKPAPEKVANHAFVVTHKASAGLDTETPTRATEAPAQVTLQKTDLPPDENHKQPDLLTPASKFKAGFTGGGSFSPVKKALSANALLHSALSHKKGGKASNTDTILLVILCLFWWLNLVAVWLHAGRKINNDFWITLLLNLLVLPGIVYAILVVLDVLSFV